MQKKTLIDKYLPQYTFNEYHETVVNYPIENVYQIAKDVDLSKSKSIKFLFKLRRLPTKRLNLQNFINDIGFSNLEENFPHENLIGFWARVKIAKIPSYEEFINNSISPWIKVVWNFQFEEMEGNRTKVSTETRVLCVAPITKFTFGLYWSVIKPFSGLTRKKMLKIIKDESESLKIMANKAN
ncbi:MAG: hypothetical protein H8D87_19185 [Deltaproteobacteria bacterium]|uniref:hypothetical protein n=1 Tax=Desulfobacula sp. TaxID=2593537 RepID=UPI00199C42CB|nr:hypothetical protein [Candidatus Desulfobacula maris]MBL6992644.1 hypothetical protein [Desulfobacula sp.]